jgi:peptidyl-prolyl cis-trans isomerase SurA
MNRLIASLALVLAVILAPPSHAQSREGIAAIVNDEVVSVRDLENRIALFLLTANLQDRLEVRERLAPQILSALIDETLKRQEARRLNIVVTREEIDRSLIDVAQQINVAPAELVSYLQKHNVPVATLIDQIEAEIAWIKTVNRLGRDLITVGEDNIDDELARRRQMAGQTEYRVAEIFLPVDTAADEQKVQDVASQLFDQLRRGASFPGLARIFSQGSAASSGGDLGWVRSGQIDDEIEKVLVNLQPGQVAGPIRTSTGYHLIALLNRRAALPSTGRVVLSLQQLFLPVAAATLASEVAAKVERTRDATQEVKLCTDLEGSVSKKDGWVTTSINQVDLRQLPPELQRVLAPMTSGEKTAPIRSADGIVILMVCDRKEEQADTETREMARRFLREQRMATASRRFLRDLRRNALIDVRQ